MPKRTPLFESHQKLGGKIVEFGGWEMPVHYTSIIDEHLAVRNAAGLFDISHMGEVSVSGAAAADFLNLVLTNDIGRIPPGRGQYTLMCNERGGVVDDLYVYHIGDNDFLLVINASRTGADVAWLSNQRSRFTRKDSVQVRDVSADCGAVAIQGPRVREFIGSVFGGHSDGGTPVSSACDLKKNEIGLWETFTVELPLGEVWPGDVWLARTGYTGEDGYEVVAKADMMELIWNRIVEAGQPFGLKPCGLGARDTLRTEMCYPLYGHELNENTTPIEAGLGFAVALDKGEFIGREALARQKSGGITKKCVAFKMTGKSPPPRPHYPIWSVGAEAKPIGEVVSGTQSPSLGIGIGMGYVPPDFAKVGTAIEIEIRGRRMPAVVVAKPIYKKAV